MAVKRLLILAAAASLSAVLGAQEILRGRFDVELEPVSATRPGDPYPLDEAAAHGRALAEASGVFAAMIYGWEFEYSFGDRSRRIQERFEAEPLGAILYGDPRLTVTDALEERSVLQIWAEYRLDQAQSRAYSVVREGAARPSQGIGSAPQADGPEGKAAALRDAAREAVRSVLAGSERNRPKEAFGTATLLDVPRYWIAAGRYQCAARFRVTVKDIIYYRYF